MRDDTTQQSVVFKDWFGRPVVVRFDQPDSSSDGGALLLKACDEQLGLTDALAGCLDDCRQQSKVEHSFHDLVRQRVFGIACGYEDCNDAARVGADPIHKVLVGRDPMVGAALASQSTLSRFENALGPKSLMCMGLALADAVILRHRKRLRGRVKRITVELDPTDDPTHGAQQLSFFNGHYDTWCYLPTAGFIQFDDEPEQYLFAYVLRPGNASAKLGAIGILRRVLDRLRRAFPRAKVLVRLDGGFAGPQMFEFLEAERVEYVVAMAENKVLKRIAEPLMKQARRMSKKSGETEHLYGECRYAAGSWNRERRVIIKAEVVRLGSREPKDNARFVVTNLRRVPQRVYEAVYCQRANIENRIKELHYGLAIDRTSCTSLGQPDARDAHRGCLRTDAGASASCRRHLVRACSGHNVARTTVQARRMAPVLGTTCRHPSARVRAVALGMVRSRSRTWSCTQLIATSSQTSYCSPNHLGAGSVRLGGVKCCSIDPELPLRHAKHRPVALSGSDQSANTERVAQWARFRPTSYIVRAKVFT